MGGCSCDTTHSPSVRDHAVRQQGVCTTTADDLQVPTGNTGQTATPQQASDFKHLGQLLVALSSQFGETGKQKS